MSESSTYIDLDDEWTQLSMTANVFAGLSIVLALFILGSALYLRSRPDLRHTIDRVSFRLMLWSMIAEILFGINYLGQIAIPYDYTGWGCVVSTYMMFAMMGVVNWLCTCIAINLMLTIVFWINPVKTGLEKWYVIGSMVMGLVPGIFAAALGHYGLDPQEGTCYFTSDNKTTRRARFILDVYLWQGLSCLVSIGATVTVLVNIYRQSRDNAAVLLAANPLNDAILPPASRKILSKRFFSIARRISWYPITLFIINVFCLICDLRWNEIGGIQTRGDVILLGFYNTLFGGRGIVFALLGIFVDPCLRKGLRTASSTWGDSAASAKISLLRKFGSSCVSGSSDLPANGEHRASTLAPALNYDDAVSQMVEDGPAHNKARASLDFVSALKELENPHEGLTAMPAGFPDNDPSVEAMERLDCIEAQRYYDGFVTRL